MTDRTVRFTESFFDRLEELLPNERGADGTPSITDFISLEIPSIRDRLALDAMNATLPTALPDVRVCISAGNLVRGFVAYVTIGDHDVEGFHISFDAD